MLNVLGEIPKEHGKWFEAVMSFYLCGEQPAETASAEKLLDWVKDSPAIWADFRIYAGINLDTVDMHWWEFMALFRSLPGESRIKRIMADRAIDLSKIRDPEMRAEFAERKQAVSLMPLDVDWDAPYERM